MEKSCTTQTVLVLARRPSSEIIRTRVCAAFTSHGYYTRAAFICSEILILWLLFDGGKYSRAENIQRKVVLGQVLTL